MTRSPITGKQEFTSPQGTRACPVCDGRGVVRAIVRAYGLVRCLHCDGRGYVLRSGRAIEIRETRNDGAIGTCPACGQTVREGVLHV